MMAEKIHLSILLWLTLVASPAFARYGSLNTHNVHRRQSEQADQYPTYNISIPLDHFHNESRYEPHTNATFTAFYKLDTSTYKPGGPVLVATLGEDSFSFDEGWLRTGLIHQIANATGGVAVLWAQRYYSGGDIVPDYVYTTENLRFHSTEQAMADLAYFSRHVRFPALEDRNLTAPGTPWILIGGSYGGVISAYSRIQYPDLFWGALSSSGVTRPIIDFWQYPDVVRRYGPPDCVRNIQIVTDIIDNIIESGNRTAVTELKTAFGAQELKLDTDFLQLLTQTSSEWQGQSWFYNYQFSGPNTLCSNITSPTLLPYPNPPTEFTADSILTNGKYPLSTHPNLTLALRNFIISIKYSTDYCTNLTLCYGSEIVNQPGPFPYLTCIESGGFVTGYRAGTPGRPNALPVVSRLITKELYIENCRKIYNFTSSYYGPDIGWSLKYGGFSMSYPRLALSTGQLDAYRPMTALAEFVSDDGDDNWNPYEPNPRLQGKGKDGTASEPQIVIEGGVHEWDLDGVAADKVNATYPPDAVKEAQRREVMAVTGWFEVWKHEHGGKEEPGLL